MQKLDGTLILPPSQHPWLQQRHEVQQRLLDWCDRNGIGCKIGGIDATFINGIDYDKIVCIYLFDLIHSYQYFSQIDSVCQQQGKKIWLVTDNVIDYQHFAFRNLKICSFYELLGMTALSDYESLRENPSKLFNCFIQRAEAIRQSWFYFLYLNDLLDRGYVTFLLHQKNEFSRLRGLELFDYIHTNFELKSLQKFCKAYDELRSLVPFRNISEDKDLTWYISDSKYSIILETYASEDDYGAWCWTEKLMRSLQTPTINLPFVQKHSMAKLKNLGLEFDNSVLEIDCLDWQSRQQKLLQIVIDDAIIRNTSQISELSRHNFSILNDWKTRYQNNTFFDQLFDEIISA